MKSCNICWLFFPLDFSLLLVTEYYLSTVANYIQHSHKCNVPSFFSFLLSLHHFFLFFFQLAFFVYLYVANCNITSQKIIYIPLPLLLLTTNSSSLKGILHINYDFQLNVSLHPLHNHSNRRYEVYYFFMHTKFLIIYNSYIFA